MNLTKHDFNLNRSDRESIKNQKACTVWMSGLSASGKSTIANILEIKLHAMGKHTYIMDGDNTRLGLNSNLGFSDEDRDENLRRVAEVCKLMNDAGLIVICSFISPFERNRSKAKEILGDRFLEFYIDADLSTCEDRDPKGLYKKARQGLIKLMTGIDSPYEAPLHPTITINTINEPIEQSVKRIILSLI
jgi:adenylyl-sulfate kinase